MIESEVVVDTLLALFGDDRVEALENGPHAELIFVIAWGVLEIVSAIKESDDR